jgi:SAM-dependent methyltransferase
LVNAPPLRAGARLPWDDAEFSERMLREHLDARHDLASRRPETIDAHVEWLDGQMPRGGRVLDLGCGPGLYTQRLAERGHDCIGVDVSPAVIGYAQDRALQSAGVCKYLLADVRAVDVHGEFDLVMLLYGEINTFAPYEVVPIMRAIARNLAPGGLALIEVSTEAGVRRKASAPNSWYVADDGLFASSRHVVLRESAWDDAANAAVERWSVIDAVERFTRYESTTWLLDDSRIEALLASSGLELCDRSADLTGVPYYAESDFQTLRLQRK